jgi:YD repeat-containing protein
MRHKLFLLLAAIAMHAIYAHAQSTPPQLVSVVRPSPNVQAMQKYGDIPISAYNGIPNISVPIYTIKFRDITVPVSLSYHASGIKVSEEASQVGLGWALNGGGTVSRTIIGKDDFLYNYFNTAVPDFSDGIFPLKTVDSKVDHVIGTGCRFPYINTYGTQTLDTMDLISQIQGNPSEDFQPDQYYFNFPGQSGKFVLKRDKTAVLQSQRKMKITYSASGFSIVDIDGSTYDFTLTETNTDGAQTHTSAWYLTKITSATGNIVTFNYSNITTNYVKPVGSYSESREDWEAIIPSGTNPDAPPMAPYQYGTTPGMQYYQRLLSSIDFPTGQVKFNYSNNRADITYEAELDSVQVFSKDKSGTLSATPFKTVVMSYGYFSALTQGYFTSGTFDNDTKRLKLNQVQEIGYYNGHREVENPYKFTYCESINSLSLPAKTSLARDHWGYFNGRIYNSSLIPSVLILHVNNAIIHMLGAEGPERNPDTAYVKAFSLTNIQYPTGGSTDFQYEANDFDDSLSEVHDAASKSGYTALTNLTSQSATVSYDGIAHTYNAGNIVDISSEVWGYVPPSTVWPIYSDLTLNMVFMNKTSNCSTKGLPNTGQIWWDILDSAGHSVHTVDLGNNPTPMCTGSTTQFDCAVCNGGPIYYLNKTIQLPPGKYTFVAHCDTSISYMQIVPHWQVMNVISPDGDSTVIPPKFLYAGGLRVKRVIDHDGISASNDKVKKYVYHYLADKDNNGTPEEYSYGIRMSKPRYSFFTVSWDLMSQTINACQSYFFQTIHLNRSSDSETPLNGSAAGSVVGYSQVTELFGENGENGKKVYQYTNEIDFAYSYQEGFTGLMLPIRPPTGATTANAFNGELLHETDYANNGNGFIKLKETTNHYFTDVNTNIVSGLEDRLTPTSNVGEQCQTWTPQPCTTNTLLTYTALRSQWHYLTSTDDKVYNQGDTTQYVETVTNYTYDPLSLLLATTAVTNSKGEVTTTTTKYPLNFTTTSATDAFTLGVKKLQSSHVISAPVEKYIQKSNIDGTNIRTVGSVLTSYSSGTITPALMYSSMLAIPNTSFIPASINNSGLVKDGSYEPLISFDSYDAYGNILQQHKINDNNHAYVWDYQNSLPAAEAINAPQIKIACTSFEFDGSGNWTIGSAVRDATKGITGKLSYNLTNGSISKSTGIVAGDTLVVSYWSTGGQYTVTGSIASVTGKTVTLNGTNWTYYEHTVTGVTTVTVSGTSNIDELRLYPKYAQMTSYTFDPIVGMTSQCDVNNRVSYYDYDGLGRLKDIKDQDGNILKTFEYHYKQ